GRALRSLDNAITGIQNVLLAEPYAWVIRESLADPTCGCWHFQRSRAHFTRVSSLNMVASADRHLRAAARGLALRSTTAGRPVHVLGNVLGRSSIVSVEPHVIGVITFTANDNCSYGSLGSLDPRSPFLDDESAVTT